MTFGNSQDISAILYSLGYDTLRVTIVMVLGLYSLLRLLMAFLPGQAAGLTCVVLFHVAQTLLRFHIQPRMMLIS